MKQLNKTLNIRNALETYFSYIKYEYYILKVSFDKACNDYRITTEDCTVYLNELLTEENSDTRLLKDLINN